MESVRALFKFQTPYKVLHLHQQSILQRVGWGATLKLLCGHWDHVTRPALWFRAALEINGRGLFKETKGADTAFREGLCGSTWYRYQPVPGLFISAHRVWCMFLTFCVFCAAFFTLCNDIRHKSSGSLVGLFGSSAASSLPGSNATALASPDSGIFCKSSLKIL